MVLEHQDIKRYLRQRYPLLLVDRVIELDDEHAVGIKNVTGSDACLRGHFPDEPLFPGVLLVEAMSQVGGILMALDGRFRNARGGYLAKIDKVKFSRFIRPGDQVVMTARKARCVGRVARAIVEATVDSHHVGRGEITYHLP